MNTLILTPEAMFQGDLLLVNPSFPHHPLPHPDLVTVADTDILLERRAAQALDSLMAAIGGWKEIVPVSGWRALEEQQAIWEDSLAENGLPFTQTYVAYPGHSEHQTGLAIDLGRRSASIDFIRPDFPYTGLCQTFRREISRPATPRSRRLSPSSTASWLRSANPKSSSSPWSWTTTCWRK